MIRIKRLKRKIIGSLLLVLILAVAIVAPVLGQTFYAPITVTESAGTDYEMLSIIATANITYMAAQGYITATGLDTRVTVGGTELPHLLADERIVFSAATANNSVQEFWFTLGNSALSSYYTTIGYGGTISVADNLVTELDDDFVLIQKGWLDASAGAAKNLAIKTNAFQLYLSAAGTVTATVDPAGVPKSVTKAGLASGEYEFMVSANVTHLHMWVDGVLENTTPLLGTSVPDNGNAWTLLQNNVMPYMEYFKIWVR